MRGHAYKSTPSRMTRERTRECPVPEPLSESSSPADAHLWPDNHDRGAEGPCRRDGHADAVASSSASAPISGPTHPSRPRRPHQCRPVRTWESPLSYCSQVIPMNRASTTSSFVPAMRMNEDGSIRACVEKRGPAETVGPSSGDLGHLRLGGAHQVDEASKVACPWNVRAYRAAQSRRTPVEEDETVQRLVGARETRRPGMSRQFRPALPTQALSARPSTARIP